MTDDQENTAEPMPALTRGQARLLEAAVQIREDAPDSEEKAFMTRYLVHATLPHSAPKGTPPV